MEAPAPQTAPVMSVKDWLITLIVLCIPIVGLIMSIVWAVNHVNENKRNFFRAYWIFIAIFMALYIALIVVGFSLAGISGGY